MLLFLICVTAVAFRWHSATALELPRTDLTLRPGRSRGEFPISNLELAIVWITITLKVNIQANSV
jgi:hypothetical protein